MNYDLSQTQLEIPPPATHSRRPFLTSLPEPGHFLLVLDNTSLTKIKRCHYAARNYLILGREAHAKNAALTFGGALHEGLELFHKFQWNEVNNPNYEGPGVGPAAQDQAILRYFTENPAPPDEYRTPNVCLEVMKHYRTQSNILLHPDYEWEILADDNGPIIERAFELPMGVLEVNDTMNMPWLKPEDLWIQCPGRDHTNDVHVSHIHVAWSGRIDVVANCMNRARICDNKTTSIAGDQFVQAFQIASQTLGYTWAGRQLWPHLDISGFCLNAIYLKKPTAKADLTKSLLDRGPRGGEPRLSFFRSYFDYSADRVDQWAGDTLCFIEDFIHSLVRNHFPLNDDQCFNKYGACPYHAGVCTVDDPAMREKLLQSQMFKDVTWNPTAP